MLIFNFNKKFIFFSLFVFTLNLLHSQSRKDFDLGRKESSMNIQKMDNGNIKNALRILQNSKAVLSEGFESGVFPPAGWKRIDSDSDGFNFLPYSYTGSAHTGIYSAASASYYGVPLTPNNHLITPALIPSISDTVFSFWYAAQDIDYPSDKFQVLVSTTGNDALDFTDTISIITILDTAWVQQIISLTQYIGDTIYISINHFDCTDWFMMKIDDVEGPRVYITPDLALTNITEPVDNCMLGNENVTIEITNYGEDSVFSFDIAFNVDNGNYIYETYLGPPIPGFSSVLYSFSAKADLSTVRSHIIRAKIIYQPDLALWNNENYINVYNFPLVTIPYASSYEFYEPEWKILNIAGTPGGWSIISNGVYSYSGLANAVCYTPSSDDWLISTCLSLQAGVDYEVSLWTKTRIGGNESFSIMLGQSPDANGLTTKLKDVAVLSDTYFSVKAPFTVTSNGTYYVGIHANSPNSTMDFYIDDFMVDDVFVGIENVDTIQKIEIFPNPASSSININSSFIMNSIRIYDVIGQQILLIKPNINQINLDISSFKNGMYYLEIESQNKKIAKKLIINR